MNKDELLNLLDIWLLGCKHDTEIVYENCRKCPSRKACKRASKQIRKLIEDKPRVTKKFIEKWLEEFLYGAPESYPMIIKAMLKEAGLEEEK